MRPVGIRQRQLSGRLFVKLVGLGGCGVLLFAGLRTLRRELLNLEGQLGSMPVQLGDCLDGGEAAPVVVGRGRNPCFQVDCGGICRVAQAVHQSGETLASCGLVAVSRSVALFQALALLCQLGQPLLEVGHRRGRSDGPPDRVLSCTVTFRQVGDRFGGVVAQLGHTLVESVLECRVLADGGHVGCVGTFEVGRRNRSDSRRRNRRTRVLGRAAHRAVVALDQRARQTRRRIGGEGTHEVGVGGGMTLNRCDGVGQLGLVLVPALRQPKCCRRSFGPAAMVCDALGHLTCSVPLVGEPVGFDRERLRLLCDGSELDVDVGQSEALAVEGNPGVAQPGRVGEVGMGAIGAARQRGEYFSLGVQRTLLERQLCLLYTSPSPRDRTRSRMPSSA